MNKAVEQLRQQCLKAGKSFIYNSDEEQDDEKQVAYFYFVGKDGTREVIYDAFMCTLSFDYKMAVWDEAEAKIVENHPSLDGKDYLEYTEKQQDEYDDILDEIYEKGLVRVQETLDIFEHDDEEKMGLEITLNVPLITDAVIEKFVKDFNSDTLDLDDETYTFSFDEDE